MRKSLAWYLIFSIALASLAALFVGLHGPRAVLATSSKRAKASEPSAQPGQVAARSVKQAPAEKHDWQVGSRFGYDFDFDSRLQQQGGTSDWLSLRGSGTLLFDVIEVDSDVVRLRGAVSGLSTFVESNKQEAGGTDEQLSAELSLPFALDLRADGRVQHLSVVSRVNKGLGVLRMLVSTLQFVRPTMNEAVLPRTWLTEEDDDQGHFSARYESSPHGFRKVKLRYSELALNEQFGLVRKDIQPTVQSNVVYQLDSVGHVFWAESNTKIDVPLEPTSFSSSTHVLMKRAGGYEDRILRWDADRLQPAAMFGSSVTSDVVSTSAERKALIAGASFDQIAADMDIERTSREQWEAMSRMSALFDENPATVDQAKKALLDHTKAKHSELLIGALASAQGAAAQKGLADVAKSSEYDAETRQAAAVQLGLEAKPTSNTVQQLNQLANSATDPGLKHAALLALGTASGRTSEPEGATTLAKLATDFDASGSSAERATLMAALGNSASVNVLQQIKNGLADSDESVRAAAVVALRQIAGPEADQLIADRLLRDDSIRVRIAAITSAHMRDASPIIDAAAAAGLLQDVSPAVRLAIVGLKELGLDKLPKLAEALDLARKNDAVAEVREAAAKALSGG
ncbi:MAG: HEAT repeat domain-containing protein [Myxococcales bacterium]